MLIDHWIRTWRAPLTALLAGLGASWRDATELAQDTLVEAYLARERLRGDPVDPSVAGPWLRGIARNLWRAHRRELARSQGPEPDPQQPAPAEDDAEDPRLAQVRTVLASLPEGPRTLLYLRYLEDTPPAQVAALLGLSERAVEGRLRRARQELARRLKTTPTTPGARS